MKHFIRVHRGIEHKVLGSKEDTYVCTKCKITFNQQNFHIASAKVDRKTQKIYKRLKRKCKFCENPLRSVRQNLEKDRNTPPKTNHCQHCGRSDTQIVLHHNHKTVQFGRWSCVNCNSRYPFDTFEEHMRDAERWYNVKVK
tara:strand:+ start:74 stop:496 length:423 start_codon:yes stop_codon:yes gene_type:complete